jgi:hypothetical protein
MIQKNTAVSETVLKIIIPKPGFEFHLVNECDVDEGMRYFEKPGMVCIGLCGITFTNEACSGTWNHRDE